ncbi:MAG TPA: hypothetical protein VF332_11020 [Vicinamibacterales bacterium]
MRRVHFFEIGDQAWCPKALRCAMTDLLELFLRISSCYAPIVPRLMGALEGMGERDIVDLCAGGGGPWPRLLSARDDEPALRVLLTDKYPNTVGARRVADASHGRICSEPRSVDAMAVPRDLRGFRTMFTSFHHFRPAAAPAILVDAVNDRAGIGVFEFTERGAVAIAVLALTPLGVLIAVPFLRPVRWQTFVLTYLIPIFPLAMFFDGIVSCLRSYSPAELSTLIEPLREHGYSWEVGKARRWGWPISVTYLLGYPVDDRDARRASRNPWPKRSSFDGPMP